MATTKTEISDMLVTVKSREIQRGMLAAMRKDTRAARRHFLAAAHLELVLADDYDQAGQEVLALRSQLSAASCFWRGGQRERARALLEQLVQDHPAQADEIQQVEVELERNRD